MEGPLDSELNFNKIIKYLRSYDGWWTRTCSHYRENRSCHTKIVWVVIVTTRPDLIGNRIIRMTKVKNSQRGDSIHIYSKSASSISFVDPRVMKRFFIWNTIFHSPYSPNISGVLVNNWVRVATSICRSCQKTWSYSRCVSQISQAQDFVVGAWIRYENGIVCLIVNYII